MALNQTTLPENTGRITAATTEYPYASAKDDSTGTTGDGTPAKKAFFNDIYGFQQWILSKMGITPSGNADTALVSQYGQGLQRLISINAYSPDVDYPVFSEIIDSNGVKRVCGVANGPSSTPVNPDGDLTGAWTYPESRSLTYPSGRVLDSDYTNMSSREMRVTVTYEVALSSTGGLAVFIDSALFSNSFMRPPSSGRLTETISFDVPAGSVYRLNSVDFPVLINWAELS